MAGVLEGFISSRRRPSRSRSESGKQLHARWGDVAITAPNGGWTQHYVEDDLNNVTYQAHGSPDSQKTLVNNSPDLSFKGEIEKVSVEGIKLQTPPLIQKERSAITITIPLPWSWKPHRRSSSAGSQQQAQAAQVVEKVITAESRPVLTSITANIDEVIVAESRPATEVLRVDSPIIHTQSPVYDDVSTFFTRAVFPEKHPRLPQIQTSVAPNKSQPASAISILSPVAEKYNGLSESNNATPMENTPISRHIESAIPMGIDGQIDVATLTGRLESRRGATPPNLLSSQTPSSDEAPDTAVERPDSRCTARVPSRPSSRGPGIGEVAYMRASSRGAAEQSDGRRSASREPVQRRAGSVEPLRRRALSRESTRRCVDSLVRDVDSHSFSRESVGRRNASRDPIPGRSLSREPVRRRVDSPPPVGRRALSREPALRRADSPEPKTHRALSRGQEVHESISPDTTIPRVLFDEPVRPRAESPGPVARRAHSRGPAVRREVSPVGFGRRAYSREPYTRRRISGEYSQRAASIDPILCRGSPKDDIISRHASPREDIIFYRGTPVAGTADSDSMSDSTYPEQLTPDEATDIENETDEMYFESRKRWNGPAVVGSSGRGFYGDVVQDYKLIARDVEAELVASEAQGSGTNIVNLIKKEREKEKEKDRQKTENAKEEKVYKGPDLVPPQEELWG